MKDESIGVEKRKARRIQVGINGIMYVNEFSDEINVVVKDISRTGFSVTANNNEVVKDLIGKDVTIQFILNMGNVDYKNMIINGDVLRVQSLDKERTLIAGRTKDFSHMLNMLHEIESVQLINGFYAVRGVKVE